MLKEHFTSTKTTYKYEQRVCLRSETTVTMYIETQLDSSRSGCCVASSNARGGPFVPHHTEIRSQITVKSLFVTKHPGN